MNQNEIDLKMLDLLVEAVGNDGKNCLGCGGEFEAESEKWMPVYLTMTIENEEMKIILDDEAENEDSRLLGYVRSPMCAILVNEFVLMFMDMHNELNEVAGSVIPGFENAPLDDGTYIRKFKDGIRKSHIKVKDNPPPPEITKWN